MQTIKVITATEAKNRFGEIIKQTSLQKQRLIVERDGFPVMAVVPISDFKRLVNPKELSQEQAKWISVGQEQEQARQELQKVIKELQDQAARAQPNISEEETDQDIQEAIRAVRNQV